MQKFGAWLLVSVGVCWGLLPQAVNAESPNVLLIMTDDQGWGDIRSHGNRQIDTPNLDQLGEQSVRFDRFFVSPVCAPTRASLLTGRYDIRTGVTGVTARREVMQADEVTLAETFRAADYVTGCFGKWHNGEQYPNHPLGQGFQEFFGFCGGHWNQYFDTTLEHQGQPVETSGYLTDVITDAALTFIEKHRERPFLCYVPYNAPHSPWQLPDRYFDKYVERGFDPATASAYGMVENLDENIGRLLEKLEETGLAKQTIVVFLTDNGPNGQRFNGGMRGAKGSVHEGGVRVPCFIRWPGKLKPAVVRQNAAHIDLLPTLAELCEVPLISTRPLDGRSLVSLLRDPAGEWPDRSLFTIRVVHGNRGPVVRGAVRDSRYRYVREGDREQLYDMLQDPAQEQDLADANRVQLELMRSQWSSWFQEVGVVINDVPRIPAGHLDGPVVELPAVEAILEGNPRFANQSGFAHDWITNWTAASDRITWRLQVVHAGDYELNLRYACNEANLGSSIRVTVGTHSIQFELPQAFDEGAHERPERSLARGPRLIRQFRTINLGEISLPQGPADIVLEAPHVNGRSVCELDGLQLRTVTRQIGRCK